MQSDASRGILKTALLAAAVLVGLTFVVAVLLGVGLAGGANNDNVSTSGVVASSATPQATKGSLTERDEPWPAGVVAEMIAAADPALSLHFRSAMIERCMADQDLQYLPDLEPAAFHADRLDRPSVAQHGFGIGIASPPEVVVMSPNNDLLNAMDQPSADAWTAAQDHCVDDANALDQQVLETQYGLLPLALQQEIVELRFYDHPTLEAPLQQWSQCMLDAGFEVPHPFAMLEELAASYSSSQSPIAELQEHERALALANYDCRYGFLAPAFDATLAQLELRASDILQTSSLYQSALEEAQQ